MKRLGLDLGCRLMVFESWLVFLLIHYLVE